MDIIHDNGDAIKASNLRISGDNLVNGERKWGPENASGQQDGETAVTSGDSTTVVVENEYSVRVVWDNGDNSATLSEKSGNA
jgi:hypothetical protein